MDQVFSTAVSNHFQWHRCQGQEHVVYDYPIFLVGRGICGNGLTSTTLTIAGPSVHLTSP